MRSAPEWFQRELTRIGGVNQYGEPIFKLVWSTEPRMTVGGRFQTDGFVGYREKPAIAGEPCWALMIWEPAAMYGVPSRWEWDYRDAETGLLDCGGYPRYGRYRLLQKFMHREMTRKEEIEPFWDGLIMRQQTVVKAQFEVYRMEPCGFMLDVMLPMLRAWQRLTNAAKVAALRQEEQLKKDDFLKKAKDLRSSIKIRRGSQLVAKRAEMIERGMKEAMRIAAQSGLGMRQA